MHNFPSHFDKATNSFTYVLPGTCFPKSSIENVPKGVALEFVILMISLKNAVSNIRNF